MPDTSLIRPAPFWIGDSHRALFAWLHSPNSAPPRSTGVVIVPPLGYEAICAHGALRKLAQSLCEIGFDVLRYDHLGTGDSAGGDSDEERVAGYVEGIGRAIEALEVRTGVREVCLVGLRMGALLAVEAARRRSDVTSLVLWAPPSSGRAYVRELGALRAFHSAPAAQSAEEVSGFRFSENECDDLARLCSRVRLANGVRVLLIPRDDLPVTNEVAELSGLSSELHVLPLRGYGQSLRDPHEANTPRELLHGVRDFLDRAHPEVRDCSAIVMAMPNRVELRARADCAPSVQEEAAYFGPEDGLFGIVTHAPKPVGPVAMLWLNAGATHRVGMNRNYVTFARDLAERGITSLRFDLAGLGDSTPPRAKRETLLYSREVVADVRAAMDYMRDAHGIEQFVLAGLCAGAYGAFHTALADVRVKSAILINAQTFDFKPGDSLEIRRRQNYRAARWYRRSMMQPVSWKKALRGEVDVRRVVRLLYQRFVDKLGARFAPIDSSSPGSIRQRLLQLRSRGTRLSLVYSADDPGVGYLRDHLGHYLTSQSDAGFELEIIEGPDHTFSPLPSQRELFARIARHMVRFHGARKHAETAAQDFVEPPEPKTVLHAARRATKQAAALVFPRSLLVVRGPRRDQKIALTFDDGPTELTPAYLDVLEHYGVRATFFFVGRCCERWPIEASEVARRGHEVASHGYTHRTFPELGTRALLKELARTDELLPGGSKRKPWVRPPHGAVTLRSLYDCARAGFSTVLWSYDSRDSDSDSAGEILEGFKRSAPKPGDIVLMHEDRPPTLQALPELIEHLLGDGYDLVTLDALFR